MFKGITPTNLMQYLKKCKIYDRNLDKVRIVSLGDGNCLAEMNVQEEHTNPMGGLHGGLSATLIDSISSYALTSHPNGGAISVSVDIHMSYFKGAKIGDDIVVDAKTLKAGKTLAFLEVEIRNKQSGDVLVKGSHTKFIMGADQ